MDDIKFKTRCVDNIYYIVAEGKYLFTASDDNIAGILKLSIDEYAELLISYGAKFIGDFGFSFDLEVDINKFVDYLNNSYLIMLKLLEE